MAEDSLGPFVLAFHGEFGFQSIVKLSQEIPLGIARMLPDHIAEWTEVVDGLGVKRDDLVRVHAFLVLRVVGTGMPDDLVSETRDRFSRTGLVDVCHQAILSFSSMVYPPYGP